MTSPDVDTDTLYTHQYVITSDPPIHHLAYTLHHTPSYKRTHIGHRSSKFTLAHTQCNPRRTLQSHSKSPASLKSRPGSG
ncbi:hypothetical protein Pmani_007777 [Petrolisthes manimaculis]|uniref:Uncharacterized protein n=1 Tax=Petrolisthes manimaculis TaxID=1843537 RepID=A0AAE1UFB1_9EUCA|nr:hypothetical protein Pmani_007777 [Petrolisthes manimaculis]